MIISVPLYRAPELIGGLFNALSALAEEITELGGRLLLINDSPDDMALREELAVHLPKLADVIPAELIVNATNLGFVRTANLALGRARDLNEDVVLLNSDALPTPGMFREMAAVAYLDPMIVIVSPRSNNATICNSPYPERFRGRDLRRSQRDHEAISRRLPRLTYVPTAVGFCLYIRSFALREFGLFDEIFGHGYNEENDFIRRCNRRGYRAVLANRAFAWHRGSASFAHHVETTTKLDVANRRILDQRYPEYDSVVRRYYAGPHFRSQFLLSGLVPTDDGKLRTLFDCRLLGQHHNGTSELARHLLRAFAHTFADEFDIAILCDPPTFAFHRLDSIDGVRRCEISEARDLPFAVAFRIGQPFTWDDLNYPFASAAVVGFLMLDTIALDCQQLDVHDLDKLWRVCASDADLLTYISRFSRDQFRRRFAVRAGATETVALCSTKLAEYPIVSTEQPRVDKTRTILIVGNHYPHKAVEETVAAVRDADANVRVSVLGVSVEGLGVESRVSGELPADEVDSLFATADVVLFPSHYEGFGLPIMRSLAHNKPVVTRLRPAAVEIAERTPYAANIYLVETLDELVAMAIAFPAWSDSLTPTNIPEQSWDDAARAIGVAMKRAIGRYDYALSVNRQARLANSSGQAGLRPFRDIGSVDSSQVVQPNFDELAQMLEAYHGLGHSAWLDRLFRAPSPDRLISARLDDSIEQAMDGIENLALTLPAPGGLSDLQSVFQKWMQRLVPGARLSLRVLDHDHIDADYGLPTIDALLVFLINAGCVPLGRTRDGSAIAVEAVKLMDWRDGLDLPGSDEDFVAWCYARILGREGDTDGVRIHTGLAALYGRAAVTNAFYLSKERLARVRSRLANYFGS